MAFDSGGNVEALAADQLASYINRVERVEVEIADMNNDKKEVYAEAKAVGFDVKVMKVLIRRRRMEKSEQIESDTLLELYESALERANSSGAGSKEDDSFLD